MKTIATFLLAALTIGLAAHARTYTKLSYAGDTPKPHPTNRAPEQVVVILDPGHGGPTDLGALSVHGWPEKDVNLLLAEDIKLALEDKGYLVYLTRRNDRAIPLYDRPLKAYLKHGDCFISIHHNAPAPGKDPRTTRYEAVYYWNDIGHKLAAAIVKRMGEARKDVLPNEGTKHANFAVTRNPEIPSCLVEADFITHHEGETAAWDPAVRQRLAEAIAQGVADWHLGRRPVR